MTENTKKNPFLLMILDGWGVDDGNEHNAITAAKTPTWDTWWETNPHTLISASGHDVGLPSGQMGNSEVGHMSLGAGRTIYQDYTRISNAINDGELSNNETLQTLFSTLEHNQKALHLMGLLSPGGVHSDEQHLFELLKLAAARNIQHIYCHLFLDGRDTPPQSAMPSIQKLQLLLDELGKGQIVSVVGRFYAMDRDNRWERTESAYQLISQGQAEFNSKTGIEALEQAYLRGENDEFVKPTRVGEGPFPSMQTDDSVLFFNFRADRARQITRAFIEPSFSKFNRDLLQLGHYCTMTQYAASLPTDILFPPQQHENVLAAVLANNEKTQIRLAETEKYAHVTFFFNGGVEQPFPGEDRTLIPSPKVATYDMQPEMSAPELTDAVIGAISNGQYDVIICNFANPDMVGHTGNFQATVQAIECLDKCFARIGAALEAHQGEALITADHGNAEKMFDEQTTQAHTAHTSALVPLLYLGTRAKLKPEGGGLADVAPTLLQLLGIEQPKEMTGTSLLV